MKINIRGLTHPIFYSKKKLVSIAKVLWMSIVLLVTFSACTERNNFYLELENKLGISTKDRSGNYQEQIILKAIDSIVQAKSLVPAEYLAIQSNAVSKDDSLHTTFSLNYRLDHRLWVQDSIVGMAIFKDSSVFTLKSKDLFTTEELVIKKPKNDTYFDVYLFHMTDTIGGKIFISPPN